MDTETHLRPTLFLDALPCHIWPHDNKMGLSCYFYSRLSSPRTFVWFPTASPSSSLPLTALHMCLGMTANMQNPISKAGTEGEKMYILFFYSLPQIALIAHAGWIGLAVSICWNNLPDSSYLWTLPAEQTSQSTCFPLNPHLSQQLIPSSQTCPPNSHPLLKFVRGNFKWDMPFSRWGSGFHCSSLSFYKCSLCKDLFVGAGNLIIEKYVNKAHGCVLNLPHW